MGAIQSAINSGIATTAAAVVAGKKLSMDKEMLKAAKTIELASVENSISDTEAAIKKNEDFQKNAPGVLDTDPSADYDPITGKVAYKQNIFSDKEAYNQAVTYNKQKMENSARTLQLNLEGLKMQRKSINKLLGRREVEE